MSRKNRYLYHVNLLGMGFLKILLNLIVLWAFYQPCPDRLFASPPLFEYSEKDLSDHHRNKVFFPNPQVILIKAEDLSSGTDYTILKYLGLIAFDWRHADVEKDILGSTSFHHIAYRKLILFPFHSYL